jgi:hypothetical protein
VEMKRRGLIYNTILVRALSECGEPQANLNFVHFSNVVAHVSYIIFIKLGNILNAVDLSVCYVMAELFQAQWSLFVPPV